ncbi:nitroreductase family deazaflavin-dependent oxidoreductase [Lapillicoccus sp.]|uniref:nitroreductase family deazaflavin-dependent oxidoreductase n=1 Tax=Lapillicoccus sp. TaxID=1909287 RepID=UPI003265D479
MPVPTAVTGFNKRVLNPVLRRLAGHGWFVEIEHVGRKSGRTFRTPIMAFRSSAGDAVTIALTYGPDVDWLRNIRAAGGCRMHLGPNLLTLGAPVSLTEAEGLRRMPSPPRQMLPIMGCHDFVELPVLDEQPWSAL